MTPVDSLSLGHLRIVFTNCHSHHKGAPFCVIIPQPTGWLVKNNPWRIQIRCCYLFGVPWIPSIYIYIYIPFMLAYIPAPWILWVNPLFLLLAENHQPSGLPFGVTMLAVTWNYQTIPGKSWGFDPRVVWEFFLQIPNLSLESLHLMDYDIP